MRDIENTEDMRHISWMERRKKWRVQFRIKGVLVPCGDYVDAAEARTVRDICLYSLGRWDGDANAFSQDQLDRYAPVIAKLTDAEYGILPTEQQHAGENPSRRTKLELRVEELERIVAGLQDAVGHLKSEQLRGLPTTTEGEVA